MRELDNVRRLPTPAALESASYDGLVCQCGEAWFTLTVCADKTGRIDGFASHATCSTCGTRITGLHLGDGHA